MDRKSVSFFDELFPLSPWRRPSPLEIEAFGGDGTVDIENLSNQNGEEISSFSKSSANSVENISTNAEKLEKTKNNTALDQEILDFEVSRVAENVENLSNQNGEEISSFSKSSVNSVENISTNATKLEEETENKTALDQENLDFEVSRGAKNVENLSNQDGQEISFSKFSANLPANISTNSKKLEETKNKTSPDQENLGFKASSGADDIENLSLPACSKGGLITESFSIWLHLRKNVTNHYPEHYPPKENIVIWHIFCRWTKSEKLSEIKPPLIKTRKGN